MRGLLASAASSCGCGKPLQRVEHQWHTDEDGVWRFTAHAVCSAGCRTLMQPLPPAIDEQQPTEENDG